jgi:hypothetical protein
MSKNYLFVLLSVFLTAITCMNSQTSVAGGVVSGTWTLAGSPYQVQGAIQIPNDSTLTIQPGVTVEFQGHYKLIVAGRLLAIGSATDSITFTAVNTTTGWYGIRFSLTATTNDTSKISYCRIFYGKANGSGDDTQGGGIFFKTVSKAIISNSRISNCYCVGSGGGIACFTYSNPIIRNNNISGNTGIYQGGGISTNFSAPQINNNVISYNTTGISNCVGGGIHVGYGNPTITGNLIANNSSLIGGGILCNNGTSPTIINNVIVNNKATNATEGGGGIACYNSTPVITNNTIANNTAVYGGGVTCFTNANPVLRNNIIWGNTASSSGPQIFLQDDLSDPNIYYSDIEGGSGGIEANGNFYSGTFSNTINSNPLFVSPSSGAGNLINGVSADWSLQTTSPCIDTGDPATLTPATDIAGNPRVTICRIDIGAYEFQNGTPFTATISQTSLVSCNGYTNASLVASASGSGSPYTYLWAPGGTTDDTLSNIGAGTYTLTATNSSGCVRTATFVVTQPAGMTLSSSQTNIGCNGNCTGSATVTVSGGTSPYDYLWTSSPSDTLASTPSNLCSGSYTVTVTDNMGCTKTKVVTIATPSSLSFTASTVGVSCNGGTNGSITVNATGGVAPLQYSINGGINYQLSNVFTGLAPGTYSVVTKDANGCQTSTSSKTISEPSPLLVSVNVTTVYCFSSTDGSASAVVTGGTANYFYSWNSSPVQANATATNLPAGNYTVTITDQNSCVATQTATINSSIPQLSICMATVDSISMNNIIYWDKTGFDSSSVFYIYRDTANNNFAEIGTVPFDSLSQFTDTVRTLYAANGNPNVTSWRYKISVTDTCGNVGPMSPYHQTMFFQNSSGNFSWNHYQIEGQTMPVPVLSNYRFQRDDSATGAWNTIQTVSASSTAYTDPGYAAYIATADWRVETNWTLICDPTLKLAPGSMAAVTKSRSNISNNKVFSTGIESAEKNVAVLMPNPAHSLVTIVLAKISMSCRVEIYDVMGKLAASAQLINSDSVSVNTENFAAGIYTVRIIGGDEKATLKLAIE